MRVNNRTQEFHATVESMLSRNPFNETFGLMNRKKDETQFYKIAMGIGKENEGTKVKLKKLEELVHKNTMLDDKLPEITQMIQIIKMEISKMSTEISAFQQAFKDKKIPYVMNRHALENANNIISSLQTKLLNTSNQFKDILELRTKIMREQKLRKEQYSSTGSNVGSNPSSVASSPHLFGSKLISKIGSPLSRSQSPAPQDHHTAAINSPIKSNSPARSNSPFSNPSDINPAANSIPMNSFTPPPQVIQQQQQQQQSQQPIQPIQPVQPIQQQPPQTSNKLSSTNNNNLLNPFPISQPQYYDRKPNQGIAYSNSVNYGSGGGPERRNVGGGGAKNADELLVISVDDDDDNGKGKSGSYPYAQQQQQLYEPYSQSYLDSRSSAIDSIESTIAELGQIYQNFTHILAGQRETVQRIDDNIMDVEMNVTGAQDYLMKYYKSISSNRWLIIKILFVVLIFFFIFVVFL